MPAGHSPKPSILYAMWNTQQQLAVDLHKSWVYKSHFTTKCVHHSLHNEPPKLSVVAVFIIPLLVSVSPSIHSIASSTTLSVKKVAKTTKSVAKSLKNVIKKGAATAVCPLKKAWASLSSWASSVNIFGTLLLSWGWQVPDFFFSRRWWQQWQTSILIYPGG